MIDDPDSRVSPRDHAGSGSYGETLLYDFAKFLITMPLLVLGGLLTLGGAAQARDIKLFNIIFVAASLAGAAILAFMTAHSLVDARVRGGEPPAYLPTLLKAATALLGVGTGGFLMMWLDTLS